jgi:hypothetical protein
MMPTCGRCAKRGKPDQCVYHPAPLTKISNQREALSDGSSPRVNTFSTAYQSPSIRESVYESVQPDAKRVKLTKAHEPLQSFSNLSAQPELHQQQSLEELSNPLPGPAAFDDSAGFISQSAVLAENELSIGIQPPSGATVTVATISEVHIDRGAVVLTLLKDLPAMIKYIDK